MVLSDVSILLGTVSISLFTPCKPVISVPLVVVHAGVAQALSKTIPFNARESRLGVCGRSVLSLYWAEESRPRSSAMMSKTLG